MKTNLSWAAGLYEGEGTVSFMNTRGYSYPLIQLSMTDKDVVQRFGDEIGYGKMYQLKTLPSGKECWRWAVGAKKEVRAVMAMLLPHLGTRRAHKALDVLDYLEC